VGGNRTGQSCENTAYEPKRTARRRTSHEPIRGETQGAPRTDEKDQDEENGVLKRHQNIFEPASHNTSVRHTVPLLVRVRSAVGFLAKGTSTLYFVFKAGEVERVAEQKSSRIEL